MLKQKYNEHPIILFRIYLNSSEPVNGLCSPDRLYKQLQSRSVSLGSTLPQAVRGEEFTCFTEGDNSSFSMDIIKSMARSGEAEMRQKSSKQCNLWGYSGHDCYIFIEASLAEVL